MSGSPVNRPQAWRMRPAEAAQFAADRKHCETRKCRNPVAIVTWRWWKSSATGRFLVAEHLVCERHGTEFAQRHHITVDPAGEIEVRRLSDDEAAEVGDAGWHCDWPACRIPATWIFTQRYTVRGEPRSDTDLSCDDHAANFADRCHISITTDDGGSW